MTVVSTLPPSEGSELERSIILNIFSSIGRCRFLEEKHFDACTALSGSGPAFACIFLEAMADGGVMMGLPRAEALELAAQSEHSSDARTIRTGLASLTPGFSLAGRRPHDLAGRNSPRAAQGCRHEYVVLPPCSPE